MDDKQKTPGIVVAIFALLGLFSLPQVIKSPDGPTPRLAVEKNSTSSTVSGPEADDDEDADRRDLRPLLDYLSDGQPEPSRPPELKKYLREKLRETKVHCLLITLPNPVESVASIGLMNTWTWSNGPSSCKSTHWTGVSCPGRKPLRARTRRRTGGRPCGCWA